MPRRMSLVPAVLALGVLVWHHRSVGGGPLAVAGESPAALTSWHDGPAKRTIVAFVQRVTTTGSPTYVPPAERIATFDNDGTLWVEQPFYAQGAFVVDRIKALSRQHPEWRHQQPFQAVLSGDPAALRRLTEPDVAQLVAVTHAGMTPDAFRTTARSWLQTARHPRFQRPYPACAYRPMLDLLAYLRANGFATYIVSGGGTDFIRAYADGTYGIPSERTIGSSGKTRFVVEDGQAVLVKLPALDTYDDKDGKPKTINRHIGHRPILAFGNSDGDLAMLQYTASGQGERLMLLLHHDDPVREYAYDRHSPVGRLDKAWDEAKRRGWLVVSMKGDFRTVFGEPAGGTGP